MSASDSSSVLPSDPFDQLLSRLIGLPNGAHTQPTVVQSVDFYGNVTSYMVQTVKAPQRPAVDARKGALVEEGLTVFVTQVNASGSSRYILPAAVLRAIDRQRDATTTQIRRRHGKRLAAERVGGANPFTPEMRAKALATRRRKAAQRAKRRAR